MQVWKKIKKKIGLVLATFALAFTATPTLKPEAKGDDTIEAFIKMFKGDEMTKSEFQANKLTEKDCKFFGVYLSNWYVPFLTQVGRGASASSEDGDDSNNNSSTLDDLGTNYTTLVKAVTDDTSFTEENAKMMVKVVLSNIRNNFAKLDVYFGDDKGPSSNKVDVLSPCTVSIFMSIMSGGTARMLNDVKEALPTKEIKDNFDAQTDLAKYNHVYFVAEGNTAKRPVFDAIIPKDPEAAEISLSKSQQILWQCYQETCIKAETRKYMALTVLDMKESDFDKNDFKDGVIPTHPKNVVSDYCKKRGAESIKNSMDNTVMVVDCFGDIIVAGRNYQYIAVPACVNPYTWVNVYSTTDPDGQGGDSVPILSGPMLSRWYSKDNTISLSTEKEKLGGKNGKLTEGGKRLIKRNSNSSNNNTSDSTSNINRIVPDNTVETPDDNGTTVTNRDKERNNIVSPVPSDMKTFDSLTPFDPNKNGHIGVLQATSGAYTDSLKTYIGFGSGNKIISKLPSKQEIKSLSSNTKVDKWQSVSSYPYLNNPKRNTTENNSKDKAILLSILKIACNSKDALNITTGNITINYDNGTWQLLNIGSSGLSNISVSNIKNAFNNHNEWIKTASKSAKDGYDFLMKKDGLFSDTYYKQIAEGDDFYSLLEADIYGLKNTFSNTSKNGELIVGDNPADSSSNNEISSTTAKVEYTYTKIKYTVIKSQQSDHEDAITSGVYTFFPYYHGKLETGALLNVADHIASVAGNSALADYGDARKLYREENPNQSNLYGVFSPAGTGDSWGFGFINPSKAGLKSDTTDSYNLLTNYVAVELTGLASNEQGDYDTFNITQFLDVDKSDIPNPFRSESVSVFDKGMDATKEGGIQGYRFSDDTACYIYLTYLFAGVATRAEDLGFCFSEGNFPDLDNKTLDMSLEDAEDSAEERNNAIRDWIYYLLHPLEGIDYLRIWTENKINGILVGWHDSMNGTTGIGSLTGTTRYKGFTGMTTCPTLQDTTLTAKMDAVYQNMMWVMIFLCLALLFIGFVTNTIGGFGKLVIWGIVLATLIVLPSRLLNTAISVTNVVSSQFFDDKFIYWALIQQQMYNTEIDEAAKEATQSYDTYLRSLYKTNAEATRTQGSNSITVRWQAVKKLRSVEYSENDVDTLNNDNMSQYSQATKLLDTMLEGGLNGQSFSETTNTYLYRNYIDIANNSRFIYKAIVDKYPALGRNSDTSYWTNAKLADSLKDIENNKNGYTNKPASVLNGSNYTYVTAMLNSQVIAKGFQSINKIESNEIDSLDSRVGVANDAFAFSQKSFNTGAEIKETIKTTMDGAKIARAPKEDFNEDDYNNEEFYSIAAYTLMSESPYYFFSWYLYGQGLSCEATGGDGYKKLLIGEDNQAFFNMVVDDKATDKLKDFMDLEHMFKYVMPYLRMGNDVVDKWIEEFGGIYTYDNIPLEEGFAEELKTTEEGNEELAQKYWNNINVRRLYNIYSPWVDQIDSSSYAKKQTISASGVKYTIENPCDPYTYPEERPMIFSRAEADAYGYVDGQLTDAELRIIKFEENARKSLVELLNYSGFDDSVLNAAASMECLFAFNQAFSDTSILGDKTEMYPTNFEVKDFSYDAFLRFILSNNAADTVAGDGESSADMTALEDMQQAGYGNTLAEKGFYQRVVSKGSYFTSVLLIINDILAIYFLPLAKYLFIIAIYLLIIIEIIFLAYRLSKGENALKKFFNLAIKPLLYFCLLMIVFSFIVAILMGNVTAPLTGSNLISLQLGSPDIVLVLLVIVLCWVSFCLFKIVWGVLKSLKSDGKVLFRNIGAQFMAGFTALTSFFKGDKGQGGSGSRSTQGGSAGAGGSDGQEPASNRGIFGWFNERKDRKYSEDPYDDDKPTKNKNKPVDDDEEDDEKAEKEAEEINAKIKAGAQKGKQ